LNIKKAVLLFSQIQQTARLEASMISTAVVVLFFFHHIQSVVYCLERIILEERLFNFPIILFS